MRFFESLCQDRTVDDNRAVSLSPFAFPATKQWTHSSEDRFGGIEHSFAWNNNGFDGSSIVQVS